MSNTVEEARRYLNNAKEILSEKGKKEDGFYKDTNYVKLAGHAAYTGVLVALDGLFGKKRRGRKDVDWYKERLSTMDKKLLYTFVAAYDTLHLSMSYDGNPAADIAVSGLNMAESIITWVETRSATA
ncbi:DUF5618 family protein [Dyadobacter sediminis]|uniref:DUF5618 domain-containing protein n=1 Tax=Dyadobacter sediminis TaxID=1493691 RepID=A0A5R9KFB4_9BACT|nr:DUF5618 family protein [Dyadobacter sediminis]TLU94731.1 hypothetical protein FEM55_10935 [Dyadobacter sediminis]GGB88638.1 hypothetical protein GCM10011325_15220 [Dyadobacter sediminis]